MGAIRPPGRRGSWLLIAVVPPLVGLAQVLLAVGHGQPVLPAVGFAALLCVFAAVGAGHHAAARRLEHLERSVSDTGDR